METTKDTSNETRSPHLLLSFRFALTLPSKYIMIASCTFQSRASGLLGRIRWDIARQGYGVIDVVHDSGDDAHILQFIDVKTGWSEGIAAGSLHARKEKSPRQHR